MKHIHLIIKILVGSLFIFSGLIKINDPIGTAIKLEEYFDVFAKDISSLFHILVPYSLPIAIFIIVLEVILGVSLLISWRKKDTLWVLLGLIIFFTFLTFYSAYFNKVTDCGCFGDAIKLTPWGSFIKDIILLVLVISLILTNTSENEMNKTATIILISATFFSFGLAWYALEHLPFIDFRAYKVGANIPALMIPPTPKEPCKYKYILIRNGKEEEFDKIPNDYQEQGYQFSRMIKLNAELCSPAPEITDFNLTTENGNDTTQAIFQGNWLILIFQKSKELNFNNTKSLIELAKRAVGNIQVLIATCDKGDKFQNTISELRNLGIAVAYIDEKVAKTIMRSNPGTLALSNGKVVGKWHYNDTPDFEELQSKFN